jgi:hypothetical protein
MTHRLTIVAVLLLAACGPTSRDQVGWNRWYDVVQDDCDPPSDSCPCGLILHSEKRDGSAWGFRRVQTLPCERAFEVADSLNAKMEEPKRRPAD